MLDGLADGAFAAPRPLLDRAGDVLRLGQYWDDERDEWTRVPHSHFAEYLGICAIPVDWDEDGDLDLLLGSNEGRIFLRRNEGTIHEHAFATESELLHAGAEPMEVAGHAMPVVADWDADGLFDLISGTRQGSVVWFRNLGERGKPRFATSETLFERTDESVEVVGERTQVTVGDYDADGDLDLLIGDFHQISTRAPHGGGFDSWKLIQVEHEYHGWVWLLRRLGTGAAVPGG